jgi:hypothetical protein
MASRKGGTEKGVRNTETVLHIKKIVSLIIKYQKLVLRTGRLFTSLVFDLHVSRQSSSPLLPHSLIRTLSFRAIARNLLNNCT